MNGKDPATVIVNPAFSLSIKMSELDDFERRYISVAIRRPLTGC